MTAPWAGRLGHTSVIDAAGAIYVIGGRGSTTFLNDVWKSTDGGARAGLAPEVVGDGGGTAWVLGVLGGLGRTTGTRGVHQ
jgi:hypothetical protein